MSRDPFKPSEKGCSDETNFVNIYDDAHLDPMGPGNETHEEVKRRAAEYAKNPTKDEMGRPLKGKKK